MTRVPAHAGRLLPSERLVFALVFALMAGFVVAITLTAGGPRQHPLTGPAAAASSRAVAAGGLGQPRLRFYGGTSAPKAVSSVAADATVRPASARMDARLAVALRNLLTGYPGQVAVGVLDMTTGQQALFHPGRRFRAASITAADILAAVLIRHQQAGAPVTSEQAALVTAMMDNGSGTATTRLWRAIGAGNGLASANRLLRLRGTIPGSGDQWSRTRTTVADQLQLLADLSSARSPLPGSARDYALGLMASGTSAQRWGVSAAAAAGTSYAAGNGSLLDGQYWDVNSIGVVTHAGHVLLVAVLSSHSPSQASGLLLVSAAATAAADVIVRAGG